MFALSLHSFSSESPADKIIGFWSTKDNKAVVQIYKIKDAYFGKLISGVALYESDGKTLKKDIKNEDASKRNNTVKNSVILFNLQFKDGRWSNGNIYDPENGSTYSCKIQLNGSKLEIRGYIGFSLIGRTEIWQRTNI